MYMIQKVKNNLLNIIIFYHFEYNNYIPFEG